MAPPPGDQRCRREDERRRHQGPPRELMSLAFAHLNLPAPDLAAADAEAREALRLVPEWRYVRDFLLPMIAARRAAAPHGN
jgi:hypothetical protein